MPVSKTVDGGSSPSVGANDGSLVKWIITQRYGRWVKGSNPLGATNKIINYGKAIRISISKRIV
jgi:hypothetical protein